MGLNLSKKVETTLLSSPSFPIACDSAYSDCLALAQHAFPTLRLYQLPDAAARLHSALLPSVPILRRWVPSTPEQSQVDAALRKVQYEEKEGLTRDEFGAFAVALLRDAVISGVGKECAKVVPVGMAGIAGVGALTRAGRGLVWELMGVYGLGVAATVYFSLS